MKFRTPFLATVALLLGLGLGATVLRGRIPASDAQNTQPQTTQLQITQPQITQSQITQSQITQSRAISGTPPINEAGARLQNETNTINIVKTYEPGLVYVSTEQTVQSSPIGMMMGGSQRVEGVGSGFFVNAAGDILTNYHVVRGAQSIQIRLLNGKQSYAAKVIGKAPQYDLALLRSTQLPVSLVRPIPLGDSSQLAVGQKAVAMGAPFGLEFSVSEGIVSATNRKIPIGFQLTGSNQGISQSAIQTDAAINPGNSGGPLLDSAGRVIGINTQIISPVSSGGEGQNAGVGFAIPINTAKNLLARLQNAGGQVVAAPRIGIVPGLLALQRTQTGTQPVPIGLSSLTDAARTQLRLPARGLVIAEVSKNSPAAKAGLVGSSSTRPFQGGQIALGGDVVTAVNGQPVDGIEDLQAALIDRKVGDTVTVTLVRGGKTRQAKITLDRAAFQNN